MKRVLFLAVVAVLTVGCTRNGETDKSITTAKTTNSAVAETTETVKGETAAQASVPELAEFAEPRDFTLADINGSGEPYEEITKITGLNESQKKSLDLYRSFHMANQTGPSFYLKEHGTKEITMPDKDGIQWGMVETPYTFDSFYAVHRGFISKELLDKELETQHFRNVNGRLFVNDGGKGDIRTEKEFHIKSSTDDKVVVESGLFNDDESKDASVRYTLVKEGENRVVSARKEALLQ